MDSHPDRSPRAILAFWLPLAIQWVLMALEGPFLAAVIARLADPTFNLAAYGVAFAFAILVESPVIMLMSASTALVEDAESYRKLRRFALSLNLLSTVLLLLLLIPVVGVFVLRTLLGLPDDVVELVRGALLILLPWPAAIGYRRFLHGLMIRTGRTRRIALGTLLRLGTMGITGLLLASTGMPGAWVGAGALSAGVVLEACAAFLMSRDVVRELVGKEGPRRHGGAGDPGEVEPAPPVGIRNPAPVREPRIGAGAGRALGKVGPLPAGKARRSSFTSPGELGYPDIFRFYYPLALTAFIGLTTQPILTFFMGRAPAPVESLALFPVVMALYFLFGTLGLSFQEAAIALVGKEGEHRRELTRFSWGLAVVASGGLSLIAFTPLARLWFEGVSGLDPQLADLAFGPARIIAAAPALSVVLGLQRALLVRARRTRPITVATAIEVGVIASLFPVLGWGVGWNGVTAAMVALVWGRTAAVAFLAWRV